MFGLLKPIAVFSGVGIVALVIVLAVAAGGHGSYAPAMVLFPYSMIAANLLNRITSPLVLLALIQYPIYGVLLTVAPAGQARFATGRAIALAHAACAVLAFMGADQVFPILVDR